MAYSFTCGLLLTLITLILFIEAILSATKCYKRKELGDVEDNTYYCYDNNKPECCEQNSEFTCCESESSKSVKEQLQLWGTVGALVIIIGLVFVCCKNDYNLCNDDRPLVERMGFKQYPSLSATTATSMKDTNLHPDDSFYTPIVPRYYDRLPPLPPTTPVPEKSKSAGRARVFPKLSKSGEFGDKDNEAFLRDDVYYN